VARCAAAALVCAVAALAEARFASASAAAAVAFCLPAALSSFCEGSPVPTDSCGDAGVCGAFLPVFQLLLTGVASLLDSTFSLKRTFQSPRIARVVTLAAARVDVLKMGRWYLLSLLKTNSWPVLLLVRT